MTTNTTTQQSPPADIWEVNQRLQFDEPLSPNDKRWVNTTEARGQFSFSPLYRALGVDSEKWQLRAAPERAYLLFCGHRGCGKSTELRRVHNRLNHEHLFLTIFLDAAKSLDPNNLQYQDVLLALAESLLAQLDDKKINLDPVYLTKLQNWFGERIERHEQTKDFAAEAKAGIQAQGGIPFLSKIFAEITTAIRVNSTYKDELRRVVRNHFAEFASSFNQLIKAAEQACENKGLAKRILFIVDGTDRLRGDDAQAFFVKDVHQLQLIESIFIYSTPIHLLHEGIALKENFTSTFKLPMIKLAERDDKPYQPGLDAMREILYRRAPRCFFDNENTADYLIEHSGGHPRDLLRLLQYAFEYARGESFDRLAAEQAVHALATDYRQFLDAGDYALLRAIDDKPERENNSPRARHLLYNLALLEYNTYWWRSHPVVRTLPAYSQVPPP